MTDAALSPATWLDAALVARLRGDAPPPPDIDSRAALIERAPADPEARAWLHALIEDERQADRLARALLFERARIELSDGTTLTLDEAEQALARKEEARSHAPLRRLVDEECVKTLRFDEFRIDNREPIVSFAEEFLRGTLAARDAARDMLTAVADEPLDRPSALARALDLPDPTGGFAENSTRALAAAAREAVGTTVRAIRRIRTPRRFVGVVLEKAESVLLGTSTTVLRLDRHVRSVFGATRSVLLAQETAGRSGLWADGGMALGLMGCEVRRVVLACPRSGAERAERAVRASSLLEARAAAALLVNHAGADTPREDADREAIQTAIGSDTGLVFLRERLEGLRAGDVTVAMGAAAAYLQLRDGFDERFALRGPAWRMAAELPMPSAASAADAWTAFVNERA